MPVMDGIEATKLFRQFETEFFEIEENSHLEKQRLLIVGTLTMKRDVKRLIREWIILFQSLLGIKTFRFYFQDCLIKNG